VVFCELIYIRFIQTVAKYCAFALQLTHKLVLSFEDEKSCLLFSKLHIKLTHYEFKAEISFNINMMLADVVNSKSDSARSAGSIPARGTTLSLHVNGMNRKFAD